MFCELLGAGLLFYALKMLASHALHWAKFLPLQSENKISRQDREKILSSQILMKSNFLFRPASFFSRLV